MRNWSDIKEIYSSGLVASTSVWIFLVPAVVKLSNFTAGSLFGQGAINLISPHSLYLLYFSAMCFFLGSILFKLRCPRFLKLIDGFTEFEKQGMTCMNISESLENLDEENAKRLYIKLKGLVARATSEDIDSGNALTLSVANYNYSFAKSKLSDSFWIVYQFHQESRFYAQLFCWMFLVLGFSLLALILVSNLLIVVASI